MTWERCKPFLSYLRAAVLANLPPKQVIFNNPKHTDYDFWDLRLLKAYHFSEDFSRGGIPLWWDESDDVAFEVERRVSKSAAAIKVSEDKESSKDKKAPPGRYYVPKPKKIGGGEMPSFKDWQDQQARKKGQK